MSRRPEDLLFSVTIKDFTIQTFRCGGKGGQNVNKVETGVRLIHPPSGARAESREYRTQLENKRAAFVKITKSAQFVAWIGKATGRLKTDAEIAAQVDRDMAEDNLRVETRVDGRWQEEVQ